MVRFRKLVRCDANFHEAGRQGIREVFFSRRSRFRRLARLRTNSPADSQGRWVDRRYPALPIPATPAIRSVRELIPPDLRAPRHRRAPFLLSPIPFGNPNPHYWIRGQKTECAVGILDREGDAGGFERFRSLIAFHLVFPLPDGNHANIVGGIRFLRFQRVDQRNTAIVALRHAANIFAFASGAEHGTGILPQFRDWVRLISWQRQILPAPKTGRPLQTNPCAAVRFCRSLSVPCLSGRRGQVAPRLAPLALFEQ